MQQFDGKKVTMKQYEMQADRIPSTVVQRKIIITVVKQHNTEF